MLLDEFREIVESRRCMVEARVSIVNRLADSSSVIGQENVPMASVKKQKPTMEPRMPTSGRIHMLQAKSKNGWKNLVLKNHYAMNCEEDSLPDCAPSTKNRVQMNCWREVASPLQPLVVHLPCRSRSWSKRQEMRAGG